MKVNHRRKVKFRIPVPRSGQPHVSKRDYDRHKNKELERSLLQTLQAQKLSLHSDDSSNDMQTKLESIRKISEELENDDA